MRLEIGIIALVEEVLGVPAERHARFDWLINKPFVAHFKPFVAHFGEHYPMILNLFELMGDNREGLFAKADEYLVPDAYFPDPYHFIFEFDELQHFMTFRKETLGAYREDFPLAFNRQKYIQFCVKYEDAAIQKGSDRFRRKTADFQFINGRTAQRAFFDTLRDLLPPYA